MLITGFPVIGTNPSIKIQLLNYCEKHLYKESYEIMRSGATYTKDIHETREILYTDVNG